MAEEHLVFVVVSPEVVDVEPQGVDSLEAGVVGSEVEVVEDSEVEVVVEDSEVEVVEDSEEAVVVVVDGEAFAVHSVRDRNIYIRPLNDLGDEVVHAIKARKYGMWAVVRSLWFQ